MLTIRHRRHFYEPRVPHIVFLDGMYAGMVGKDDVLRIGAPPGRYSVKVQFGGRIPIGKKGSGIDLSVSSTKQVEVPSTGDVTCEFQDRERLWNILFDIDLVVWVVSCFVTMPPPYKIVSNAFFAIWIARVILIRKRYYKMSIS